MSAAIQNEMPSLAVMYHYVRPDHELIPAGIRPMPASEFEQQLDWLAAHYRILPPQEFLRWIASPPWAASKPPCVLTFDDGTRDHAEVVTPILVRRGLSGVFFVLTGPAEAGLMPLTHAIHWLLSEPDEFTWQLFEQHARDHLGGPEALGDPAEARRIYHYEPELRARIKYAANMAMPAEATRRIIQQAARRAGLSLEELSRQWFVSAEQIKEMHRAGMTIGLHGHSHTSLQTLGETGIQQEIRHGSDYLAHLLGHRPAWWACPFGGAGASDSAWRGMHHAMSAAGLCAAVTTRKSPVPRGSDPLAIPRYDCIDLPPRKSSPPAELDFS